MKNFPQACLWKQYQLTLDTPIHNGTINGVRSDILKDIFMTLPEYMRRYNIKLNGNKMTTFHDSTPEEKRRMLHDFILELGINLLYGVPDCQDQKCINPLKEAVKQKRANPAYLHTLGIIWGNKVLGMNNMHYITGITVQKDKEGKKIILPFDAIRVDPERGLDKHLYLGTPENPSPELYEQIKKDRFPNGALTNRGQ